MYKSDRSCGERDKTQHNNENDQEKKNAVVNRIISAKMRDDVRFHISSK